MNVAVFGLGRSGLAVARAVVQLGGSVIVYDEKAEAELPKPELASEARELGAALSLGIPFPTSLGTDYVVANPAIDKRHPALQTLCQSGSEVISEVEFAYRISKAPIVAITGTNGKSTTTALTYVALQAAGIDAVLCGNIFGSGLPEVPLTDAALRAKPDQVLVAEISSFQLEWISQFQPWVGCITTITPDHLDRYDSFQQYADTKWNLQCSLDFIVQDLAAELLKDQLERPSYTFGNASGDATVSDQAIQILGTQLKVSELAILGRHNHANVAAAGLIVACVLRRYVSEFPNSIAAERYRSEIPTRRLGQETSREASEPTRLPNEVVVALSEFPGLSHRMESLGIQKGRRFINNSMCTNPAAVQASIDSVPGRVCVLMGGVNKDLDFTPLKDFFASTKHQAFLFGRDAEQINQQMGGNHFVCITMEEAFNAATKSAKEGDFVMLAPGCASMDQFQDFRHRGDVFRQLVQNWHVKE
jgi:UDP-N-acetylmuramoylalanine--D-glutamate ligase